MRYWAVVWLVLAAVVLQTTVGNYLAIGGVTPDLLLILALTFGLLFGWEVGAGAGLAGGLLLDLTFGRFIGLHALALGSIGLVAGMMESTVVKDNPFLPAMAALLGNLMTRLLILAVLLLCQKSIVPTFRNEILISSAYNTVLCAIIYPLIYRKYDYLHPNPRGTVTGNRA